MVKFKVIKGSQLLLGAAIALLVLVVCALVVRYALSRPAVSTSVGPTVRTVSQVNGAEANNAFALSAEKSARNVEIVVVRSGSLPENEHTDEAAADILVLPQNTVMPATEASPKVLIYHTHTHEAYEQTKSDPYTALEAWRTADESHSVVRVGAELAQLLTQRGFEVVHDKTDHEQNDLSTAYLRSEKTLNSYTEAFDLYIDLHRDAYLDGMESTALTVNGESCARMMMLVGKGDNFTTKPYYQENYAFATALTEKINVLSPGLCKDVLVKTKRYNQHIGVYALLIEVGTNKNTLQEALNSMPVLADALTEMMILKPDQSLQEMRLNAMGG